MVRKSHTAPQRDADAALAEGGLSVVKLVENTLEAKRKELGLSLKDVADRLNIGQHYLEALEKSAFEALPEEAYAVGFVRSYSTLLGLDVKEMVARFKAAYASQGGLKRDERAPQVIHQIPKPKPLALLTSVALLIMLGLFFWHFY